MNLCLSHLTTIIVEEGLLLVLANSPAQVPAAVEDHVGGKWDSMLPINGTQDEVDALRQALLEERALQKVTR